ncbi:phosphate/phosphite/phosphonate ABC transporter substrate-binding protein [Myceligenerans indicum]|uniref:Phosphate/phosphite/phosphonate ABC transporter substrate-binding protein n=1 Tax=Myceligenerans indicum TaxID=2593663 RepID=A0ABS1LIJ4_9MICO|nr:phosphate/phosphite/phosphonate ABC transporter substrate-binding protein [Myceligenerans indicum]MBL0886060.1 phosphate/phosphite/phosphonate ABC transporter substrate-binding protein [Myceligenerans indicum]
MKATRVHHTTPIRAIVGLTLAALVATSLSACTPASLAAGNVCPEQGIRFGVQPSGDSANLEGAYTALADAMAEELDCSVVVRIFDSYAHTVDAMEAGELEIAQFSALGYAVASEKMAVTPVATFGMPNGNLSSYSAGIWVAADSGITRPGQLAGRTLALGAKGSASGDILPRKALADANLAAGDVRISYSGGHVAALDALTSGSAEAAEIDSRTLAAALADGSFDPDDYRHIWESGVIPDDPIVMAPEVSEELSEAVSDTLLNVAPAAIEGVAEHAGVTPGGRMVGVNDVAYAEAVDVVDTLGIDEANL